MDPPRRAKRLIALAGLVACGEAGSSLVEIDPSVQLASPYGWSALDASTDPFTDRPETATTPCAEIAARGEDFAGDPAFVVETGPCPYITVTQPNRATIAPGDHVEVRLWHFALTAPANALAHVVVRLDDEALFERRVPIPGPAKLTVVTATVAAAHAVGAPLYFHLHNHGDNSWALFGVIRRD